jgi:hypothetical protein
MAAWSASLCSAALASASASALADSSRADSSSANSQKKDLKRKQRKQAGTKTEDGQGVPPARARCSEAATWATARSAARVSARLSASAARPRDWSRSLTTRSNSDCCRCASARAAATSARRCHLGSQIGAEQPKVRHLGTLLREARSSPGERSPQGSQRARDVDLAADERRLGGAQIRQILGEGSGASRKTPWSQKRKGMPETVTWRILGTSLQKTSSDDRSDPTVASAHSRSSSQDWSSRSSSRTKTGSEASRVRNRSNWCRPSELRRTATRLPPGGTDRVSTPPSSEAPSADASAASTSAATGRSPTGTAAASIAIGAGTVGTSGGPGATSVSAASPITMAASAEEPALRTRSTATGAA